MKKILRNFIVSLLAISLVFAYLPAGASFDEKEALFQAESLDLFEKEKDGTINWDKQITRAEFSHIIAKLIKQSSDGLTYEMVDVNSTTPYSQDIYAMLLMGIMNGDPNGYFRPMDYVNAIEAATVFLRLLGYSHVINSGDYPQSVLNWGIKTKLLDSIHLSGAFTRKDFALMLHNSFDVKLMESSFITGTDSEYYISDKTFNEIVFSGGDGEGCYYGKGIVMQTAMAFVDVPYASLERDEVVINGTIYRVGDTNAAELLGMEVQFYAKELPGGIYELKSIIPTEKNEVKRIDASDFTDYVHKVSITYTEDNKNQKDSLDANVALIKNFDTIAIASEELFNFNSGEYILINNDGDSYIDVVLVYSYENAVVSGVYNDVVTIKEGFSVNGTRYLNLDKESDELLFSVVDANGKYVDVNTLSSGSVISVATDKTGKILRVIVREDAKKSGVLTSVSDDGFEFDEKCYKVIYSESYDIGAAYDYYLNFKDDIIFYELSPEENAKKYAYVIGAESGKMRGNQIKLVVSKQVDFGVEIDDSDEDDINEIPMLICQNEEIAVYYMADKVKYNGSRIDSDDVKTLVENGEGLYEFELNKDGKLSELTETEYKAGSRYTTFKYDVYDKCFGGAGSSMEGFAIDTSSQILCIPTNNDPTDDDYMVKNVINIEGNTLGYFVRGFNFNPNTKKCGLIVINREMRSDNVPGITVDSSKVAIVKSERTLITDDGEVTEIEFLLAGTEKKMPLSQAAMEVVPSLKKGDLFVYEENYEGEITNLRRIRSISDLSTQFNQSSSLGAGASEICGLLNEVVFDEVDHINTRLVMHFIIDVNGNLVTQQIPQRNKPPMYLYDLDGEVRNASIEDVIPGSDKVYVFMKNSTTTSAILIVRQ